MKGLPLTDTRTHSFSDLDSLSQFAAERLLQLANDCLHSQGSFSLALAGGSTPKRLYQYLAESEQASRLDWSRVKIYFGDERCVEPTHEDSNYRMAKEAFLAQSAIAKSQIYRMHGELENPSQAAKDYATLLNETLPQSKTGVPTFDLVLLGLGPDGHTASLFPDTDILNESKRAVASVYVEKLAAHRISLTYPTLNAASRLWILAAGSSKKEIVAAIFGDPTSKKYPIQRMRPNGSVEWFLDEAAGDGLS